SRSSAARGSAACRSRRSCSSPRRAANGSAGSPPISGRWLHMETVFTLEATPIKFGPGAVEDAGWELKRLGVKRALLVTDPGIAAVERVLEALRGIDVVVFDGARVEPTIESLQAAAD